MKTFVTAMLCTLSLCAGAFAQSPERDFQNVTSETLSTYWQQGESFKSNSNQENPDLYGRQLRKGKTNCISVVTPRTMTSYLAFSHKKRLLDMPANLDELLTQHNDLIYLVTWTPFQRGGGSAFGGSIDPQVPTQRLVIDKDGVLIRPFRMPAELEALMPHSFGAVYYAFPRSVLLDTPYIIRYVTGYGDILDMTVSPELIDGLIDDELHFYNAK